MKMTGLPTIVGLALLQYMASWRVVAIHVPFGFQSGPDVASSFAGGMYYDPMENLLYITGATYGRFFAGYSTELLIPEAQVDSDCFMSIVKLPEKAGGGPPVLLNTERWGSIGVPEACNAIAIGSRLSNQNQRHVYAVGHSEAHGLMTKLSTSVAQSTVYGTITDFEVRSFYNSNSHKLSSVTAVLQGGGLIHPTDGVHYPVAIATNVDSVFVATMVSLDDSPRQQAIGGRQQKNSDYVDLTSGGHLKYGKGFLAFVNRFDRVTDDPNQTDASVGIHETLKQTWELEAGASEDVILTSLVYVNDEVLLMAGSTRGFGPLFGANYQSVGDYDGFVTKIDPNTGIVPIPPNHTADANKFGSSYSTRIDTLPYQDDFVNGLCHYGNDVYVVGSTGSKELDENSPRGSSAFLIKLRLSTLDVVWKQEIGGIPGSTSRYPNDPAMVRGISCAVTLDGQAVYLAGTVYNDAVLDLPTGLESRGGDDVYLVQFSANSGDINFAIQVGTSENEWLAHGAGGVIVDKEGHAILLGNTEGGLLRHKNDDFTDVFFLSVERSTGKHSDIVFSTNNNSSSSGSDVGTGVVVACVLVGVALLVGFLLVLKRAHDKRRINHKQDDVIEFSEFTGDTPQSSPEQEQNNSEAKDELPAVV